MIRYGNKDDVELVNIIRKDVNNLHVVAEPNNFKDGFNREMQEYLCDFVNNDNKKFLVYECDGKICGYVMFEFVNRSGNLYMKPRSMLHIGELGVLPEYRSRGIGGQLIEEIKKIAKEKGLKQINLNLWTFNDKALKFYEKLGFEVYMSNLRLDI